ncbi:TPA: purine-nucleoside phosphorylase [Candidatus Gastranaerophilales bacterium HUM_20]|nr:purine nucleoside phosphorylase 1 [Clostridium sp. CAG:729]DAB24605.1 MAG TPA: purine-nucleoside phosphorylase [Candidatus Gastranaerophilales bacterium HUM_20]
MENTVKYLKEKTNNFNPETGIILGSGLGELADEYCNYAVPYSDIPNFIKSTVKGHKGRLVFAEINNKKTVLMQGRNHFYEGHSMQEITFPVKVMKALGVKTLILTNAAGAVNESYKPADLMIITDHINNMGSNPLIGPNDDTLGERFPDMTEVYKKDLIELAEKSANKLGMDIQKGVYWANSGPSYETPAEINMIRKLGGDAVGMSTVPEAIVANYCQIDVLGISCISNAASSATGEKLSHEEVIDTTNKAKAKFKSLILEVISNL